MGFNSGFDSKSGNPEGLARQEMDRRVLAAANCLKQMDDVAAQYGIDSSGRITGLNSPHSVDVRDPALNANLRQVLTDFADGNNAYAKYLRANDPAVIDVQVISGCVVMVYDSSKKLPLGFVGNEDRGDYNGATQVNIQDENGYAKKVSILGYVTVDINPSNRHDGVDPGTTLRHELDHHNLAVTDYLLAIDPQLNMGSAYRKGRKVALFGSDRNRLTTSQAFAADLPQYSRLTGRDPAQISESDIGQQLAYLDELHSFTRQRQEDWFSAQGQVYNYPGRVGKAWEVVGDHPADSQFARRLLAGFQAAYLCEQMVSTFRKLPQPGVGQQQLMVQVPELLNRMSSITGTARTVAEAERLVLEEWITFANSEYGRRLINSPQFVAWRQQIYASNFPVPELRVLFSEPTP